MRNENIIKCPNCDTQYLPGEIYLPEHFLGQPKDVERDITGKIVWQEGIEQNLVEIFTCEKCGKTFTVTANISYSTSIDKRKDMDEVYTSKKYGDRLFLKED
jgi:ribosomal protein L37AE/L43A